MTQASGSRLLLRSLDALADARLARTQLELAAQAAGAAIAIEAFEAAYLGPLDEEAQGPTPQVARPSREPISELGVTPTGPLVAGTALLHMAPPQAGGRPAPCSKDLPACLESGRDRRRLTAP